MKTDDAPDYSRRQLRLSYFRKADTLQVSNGDPACYRYVVAEGLAAVLDVEKEVVGFTLERAGELLVPHFSKFEAASVKRRSHYRPGVVYDSIIGVTATMTRGRNSLDSLRVSYFSEYDILDLWNEEGASIGWDVGENLLVFSRDDEGEEIKGFTLEHAAEILLPCLSGSSQTAPSSTSGD
jgi:uncharacterized protein YuzE